MTRKEAVKKALSCEPVSPLPYNLDFTRSMRQRLAERFGWNDVDKAVGNYILQINIGSNAGAEVNRVATGLMKPVGEALFRDEFGVIWNKSAGDDIGVVKNQVISVPDIDLLQLPDPKNPLRWQGYEEVASTADDRYVLTCFSSPFFQRAWFLRGMADLFVDMAENEDFVHQLLDRLTDFNLGIVDEVIKRKSDGIFFYDDYAQQTGLLFSPVMFRRYFLPRLQKIFDRAKSAGLDIFFHCCGDCSMILEDLCAVGVQVFNPFQPEVMDVGKTAAQFNGRMTFYGGISTQHTLPYGNPDEVRKEVSRMKQLFQKRGGYIVAPAHAIQKDVPLENVLALLEEARTP